MINRGFEVMLPTETKEVKEQTVLKNQIAFTIFGKKICILLNITKEEV